MPYEPDSSNSLHAFDFAKKTKPVMAIKRLQDKLQEFGTPVKLEVGEELFFSDDKETAFIFILSEGCASLCHFNTNLHTGTTFAPTIVGLIDGYSLYYDVENRPRHYIYAETRCTGYKVPLEKFVEQCDTYNLWHDVARILAQRLMTMSAMEEELVGLNAYGSIRAVLIELWLYPEDIRSQLNIAAFIQKRTNLSRSRIMAVLSALKEGGYITIKTGKLVDLNKLPKAF
ncbi:helix-turn-helix domain-containing protein [Citrobacter enshiensis]|uniref:helix-turn-helix domain-containing protein n=1 Tax=Citrobacter enshiensis TaxID=2971264 RepID=UPI0023E8902B|nr:helix-turn-helix domain-containing protein [Citrobacter enshiensis]WET42309.1 helix-turn-helix domain-containing protein [Citrobacter enshiensis]